MDEELQSFMDTMLHLHTEQKMDALARHMADDSLSLEHRLSVLDALLRQRELWLAFVFALSLEATGHQHWLISLSLSFGGLLYGSRSEHTRAIPLLREQCQGFAIEQREQAFTIISAVMADQIRLRASEPNAEKDMVYLLEICKAVIPSLRTWFDWTASVPDVTPETLRQQKIAAAPPTLYPLPANRRPRRVVLSMPDSYFVHRLQTAMLTYGYQVTVRYISGGSGTDLLVDPISVIKLCQMTGAELLVLRADQMMAHLILFHAMLIRLRQLMPDLKIMLVSIDSWTLQAGLEGERPIISIDPFYVRVLSLLDGIWESDSPFLETWNLPVFSNKVLHAPLPHAGHIGPPDPPMLARMSYIGSVHSTVHWHRSFWQLATRLLNVPVEYQQHSFVDTAGFAKKESEESMKGVHSLITYNNHKAFIHRSTVIVNLTRKPNLACIVTNRSFEVPLNGALLVQEFAPGMHHYFTPGEHYLEFRSVAELSAIARFIAEHPEDAEEIRRCGSAFAREHYSDEKLIGYLDKFLWP
ncbi:MAG: glycosyltransferase [Magnetococcus sp. MYC-9]